MKMLKETMLVTKKILIGLGILSLLAPVGLVGKAFPEKVQAAEKKTTITKTEEVLPALKPKAPLADKKSPSTEKVKPTIVLQIKTTLKPTEIDLSWRRQKLAAKYLVQWNIQGERNVFLKVTKESKVTLRNLRPNTNYEIEVSAFDKKGKVLTEKSLSLKTLVGKNKQVAGIEAAPERTITPAIGSGVSIRAPQVAQKSVQVSTPTPAPSESKAPEENQKTGWSRLLVALAILIIAAGAAIGGYYGYEWYASRSHEDGEPPESRSNRW